MQSVLGSSDPLGPKSFKQELKQTALASAEATITSVTALLQKQLYFSNTYGGADNEEPLAVRVP